MLVAVAIDADHRHQEWLKFLRRIDAETPKKLDLHLIADNYATHKHPKVKAWLAKHPRFHMHFTPTSASWLSQVERFFGLITSDQIRCGVFKSVAELETAIQEYLSSTTMPIQNPSYGPLPPPPYSKKSLVGDRR